MNRHETTGRDRLAKGAWAVLLAMAAVTAALGLLQRRLAVHPAELGACTSITGPGGELVLQTALPVSRGDRVITQSNRVYQVVDVGSGWGRAEPVPSEEQPATGDPCFAQPTDAAWAAPAGSLALPLGLTARVVVIYHSHSDESYVPTDGSASIPGRGGIMSVGDALRRTLRAVGYAVVHDRTAHDPHDALAYARSRRTAYSNLKYRPYLMFDVHRDSGPASAYVTSAGGQPICQVLIVVGRENPLMTANLSIARRIKAGADSSCPGLVKGIFLARGHYNQDLDPGALLLEVGSDQVSRDLAERSMELLAVVLARTFGAPGV